MYNSTVFSKPHLAVVGCGAIGGSLAALLIDQGLDLTLVAHGPEQAALLNAQGLVLTGVRGDKHCPVRVCGSPAELPQPLDFCLIAAKAYALPELARSLLPQLKPDALVCSLQNGVCGPELAAIVGPERAVDTVITWGATLEGPGRVRITADGELLLGMTAGPAIPRLQELAELLNAAFPTRAVPDILSHKLSKLLVNCCMTSIGALSGEKLGRSLKRREARSLFLDIVREGVAVAEALNIPVAPFGGKVDYYRLLALPEWRQQLLIRLVGLKFRNLTSSSLQSLRRGQPTEVDYLNGWIAEQGERAGVPTPVNSRIVAMVHELERGERVSDPDNLRRLSRHRG